MRYKFQNLEVNSSISGDNTDTQNESEEEPNSDTSCTSSKEDCSSNIENLSESE